MKLNAFFIALCLAMTSSPLALASRAIDSTTEHKIDEIVSVFENSTPDLQYDYIAALNDGRGYTAGRSGFTTATGDLLEVVEQYVAAKPTSSNSPALEALLPRLRNLSSSASPSLSGIETLPSIWKSVSSDSQFLRAQDLVTERLYKAPAREWCRKLGLSSPLSNLIIYDSIIQHGDGTDADSLGAIIARTHSRVEREFIAEFLEARRADLLNPANANTKDEWRESVDRVDALKRLVNSGNWELTSPLRLEVWGHVYAL